MLEFALAILIYLSVIHLDLKAFSVWFRHKIGV